MRTLILKIAQEDGTTKELRLECHRFHAAQGGSKMMNTMTIYAQDQDGSTIAVFTDVDQAYFDKVVTFQTPV